MKLGKVGAGGQKAIAEPAHDRPRQGSQLRPKLPPPIAKIGQRQHDARVHDADANLEGAIDREDRDVAAICPDRSQNVICKNRRRVAGKRRSIGSVIAQERGGEGADRAPERKSDDKPTLS